MRKVSFAAACVSALALAACGSGDQTSEAGAEGASGEVTTAGSGGSPAPSLEEKRALIAAFREGPPPGCADNFVEATDDSEGRELSGTSFVACAGSESSEEPYVLQLITEGNGQVEAGTMEFYMQANSHPLAYEALKDMMHAAAGIESDAEKVRFGAELGRFMMAGRNMPTNTYTLYETAGGVTTRVTPNSPEGGWITVRVLP
jgi:hypothetical protein